MLNTAEAARFLRVSQASIRRWFDAGLLPGHRVGRRRERRFHEADLLAFMSRSTPGAGSSAAVSVAGMSVPAPAHLAALYSSDSGGLRLTLPFLAEGMRLRQPCFLVAAGEVLERYRRELDLGQGVEVVVFQGTTADGAIAQWEELFATTLAKGPTVIRVVGEMAEELPMFASVGEMFRYEQAYDVMCKRYPMVTICQYDVRRFDGVALLQALKTHPDLFAYRSGAFLH